MNKWKRISLLFLLCVMQLYAIAQPTNMQKEESSDFMRSNGKIYVVIAVVVVILIGLFIYLLNLDRKIARLEKNSLK